MASVQEIKTSELRYRRLFEAAQDGILILDAATGAITDVNPFLIRMLGYSREEFVQKRLWEMGAFRDVKASQEAFAILQEDEYIRYEDLPLRAKDGRLVDVEFVSNVYWVGEEKVIQCNIRDISERKRAQDALLKSQELLLEQSVRDHLTGLFNRRYMEETLERELVRAMRKHVPLGIIMLDLDNLKRYNDTWGHAAGDEALRQLGSVLLNQVRREDIACRYGGDEFILILPDASTQVTLQRAERIVKLARRTSLQIDGHSLPAVTLSLGVAVFPKHGEARTAVLKAADAALYRAKRAGRNCVCMAE
ncbi:MAG TPA: sensor domain-containing diguanylate cyclase [Anaerolineales bacterium]|nr:sensor domain-containing diguanylate cyclase [Anaerolineales bacterium]